MARALKTLAVYAIGLSACLRFGYAERPGASDSGTAHKPDAGAALDAATPDDAAAGLDAAAAFDAATALDASTPAPDAAAATDAAVPRDASASVDAARSSDAATDKPDASTTADAAIAHDAGATCTPGLAFDYCTQIPALAQPPQLDGRLDCGLSLMAVTANGWTSSVTLPSDNQARYAAAWRPDGLYVYVEVDDGLVQPALASYTDPWCGDGIELYADADGRYTSAPDYDNPGAIQLIATAATGDTGTALAVDARYHTRSQRRIADWAAARHIAVARGNGYALEAFITAPDLDLSSWSLSAGNSVGFDIAINVSRTNLNQTVDCGYSLGQYYLRISRAPCTSDSCRPFANAQAFCTAVLQ